MKQICQIVKQIGKFVKRFGKNAAEELNCFGLTQPPREGRKFAMYLHYVPVIELPLLTEYVSRAVRLDTIEAVFGDLAYVKKAAGELAKVLNVALPRGQRIQHGGFSRDDGMTRRMHIAGALASFHRAYANEVRLCDALLIGYRAYEGLAAHLRNTDGWVKFDRFIHCGLAIIRGGEHKMVSCSHCSNHFVFHIDPMMAQGCPFCAAAREGTLKRIPYGAKFAPKPSVFNESSVPSVPPVVTEPAVEPSVLAALQGGSRQQIFAVAAVPEFFHQVQKPPHNNVVVSLN